MINDDKGRHSQLTAIEIDIIVQKAVRNTLTTLGIELADTKSLQSVQADFAFMRRQRQSAENLAEWIKKAAITVIIGGALATLWIGIRTALTAKGGIP